MEDCLIGRILISNLIFIGGYVYWGVRYIVGVWGIIIVDSDVWKDRLLINIMFFFFLSL